MIMRMVDIIIKKKENKRLSTEEINYFITNYVNGNIPDYQVSALLMAIYFNGMNEEEISDLTDAMLNSGDRVDLSSIDGICVDKHSTGGVGDKTSLVVGPIVSSCGLKLAKVSGRGLGHTGGTLDKLESIRGLSIEKESKDFLKQVSEIGIAIVGQSKNVCPADKKLYALRDVTATVDTIPLIASSIMCKKLASGAKTIVIDVKVGKGSFMKTIDDATKLAEELVKIGKNAKDFRRNVIAVLTDMDEPLGRMIGNSLEIKEAIETLKGKGEESFTRLCEKICVELLVESGYINDENEALRLVREKIASGAALNKLRDMIIYQGGDANVIDNYDLLPKAKECIAVRSKTSGYVQSLEALKMGLAAMKLGAGREKKEDNIDFAVGIEVNKKVGDFVKEGEALAYVYTNGKGTNEAISDIYDSYVIVDEIVKKDDIIKKIIK